jgi:hypothetical protein
MLHRYYLSTYPVSGKMKTHRNNAFSDRKNGFEIWINVSYYEKNGVVGFGSILYREVVETRNRS